MARLVDDLLDVSRVTHGKVKLQTSEVDLAEVVRSVSQAFDHVARSGGVSLSVVAATSVPVEGDRLRLEQIVGNLIGNAIKYTPRGGLVRAEVAPVGGTARLAVTDSGIGIAPEMLPRVFELFAQADVTLDRTGGGLGLGLTLVRSLTRLHGGEVEARSAGLGKGSEFVVSLPLVMQPEPSTRVASDRRPGDGKPRRVVLVEDSEDVRDLFAEALRSCGHVVASAGDGPSGVERIVAERPDVAFIDVGLPGFDGYEVARRVRAALGTGVELVAMTGYGQDDDRTRAADAGFDRHLVKPVDIRRVEAIVAEGATRPSRATPAPSS
jgi:CheY-like chemotaxis protein